MISVFVFFIQRLKFSRLINTGNIKNITGFDYNSPNLEIHSSTQMHIHNLDGTQFMEKLGVKRVVLARETSIDEIKHIKDN